MSIILMEKINKIYDTGKIQVHANKDIDLVVEKGEFISIMGASGSGKSTLMNIIGSLDNLSTGKYILDGVDMGNLSDLQVSQVRNKKIGFVFQSFNLLPKLTAIQNVELPMIYAGMSKAKRRELSAKAMEQVGLTDRADHKPNEMSGGQKQRVAIARAIGMEPAIILADEPTGNLDSKSTREILKIFQNLNAQGSTIIMVTHEPDVAEFSKRIVVVKDGIIEKDELIQQKIIE
ncbi:MAG: ABC transporter ATP-binding protein [Lachnospirales bacterium]